MTFYKTKLSWLWKNLLLSEVAEIGWILRISTHSVKIALSLITQIKAYNCPNLAAF